MFITALCPTFRRPQLAANALQLWRNQVSHDDVECELLICDDSGIFETQHSDPNVKNWRLISLTERFASLPDKYNAMLEMADPRTEAFLVWEDDDIYLPWYVKSYRKAFEAGCDLVKPSYIISDYRRGELITEQASGRFHASLGFTKKLIESIGGWPKTDRADFDQILIQNLQDNCALKCPEPFENEPCIGYVFSWHTGHPHGQHFMRSPDDLTWYQRAELNHKNTDFVGKLIPEYDQRTRRVFEMLNEFYDAGLACDSAD